MKKTFLFICLFFICHSFLHAQSKIENLIIVTTDGFRWQEVFKGMDSAIANNRNYNQNDSATIYKKYWANDPVERRKKLLPFIWSEIATNGQIYGNRDYDNKVDNANPYWFSYPGYNEIFTGFPDEKINSNAYTYNPNVNVLEFINRQPKYKGKVAAFTAWDAFDRILNEPRCGFPVIAAFDPLPRNSINSMWITKMAEDAYRPFGDEECLDVFTHYKAFDYLRVIQPKVLYISYGETDEWAHHEHYKDYLDAAHHVDQWLNDIWNFIQHSPVYKDKTALLITVDHGRGNTDKTLWTSHNNKIPDSHEIWFAVIGPGINAKGEVKEPMQLYQKQLAQTMAGLLGLRFTANHPIADKIELTR